MEDCGKLLEEVERLRRENAVLNAKLTRYVSPYSSSSVLSKPHEVLLDIICCVDFNTLVPLRFTNSVVWECIDRHAHRLARERRLGIAFSDDAIEMTDHDDESWSLKVEYDILGAAPVKAALPMRTRVLVRAIGLLGVELLKAADMEGVLREIGLEVGCHRIVSAVFRSGCWLKVPFEVFCEKIPAIKYAPRICVNNGRAVQGCANVENFVANFVRLEQLQLFDWRAGSFDWKILRSEAFLRLNYLNLGRPMEDVHEPSVDELCQYLSDVAYTDRSRTVTISRGWRWPQIAFHKIAKAIGEARGPIILSIAAERPLLARALFDSGTGWSGYRGVYRIHNALIFDDGDDNAMPGCVRWIITNYLLLGFF